jgi:hypothetical protein
MNNQNSICRGANPRDCRADELKTVIAAQSRALEEADALAQKHLTNADNEIAGLKQKISATVVAIDDFGAAIADAGYIWTPLMRKAYERAIRVVSK